MNEDVFAAVKTNVVAVVPDLDPAEITPDRSLTELGCNSVDRADIVTMAMEDLGVNVPVTEFHQVVDIGSLVALLDKYQ